MKVYYILTYEGYPVTSVYIDNDEVRVVTDEDCKPIFFDIKESASKLALALTWIDGDWNYGWEKVYV